MHPLHCPACVPRGQVRQFLRRGKPLVLPRFWDHATTPEGAPDAFLPRPNEDYRFGRLGKIPVLRYHPLAGSSHPAGLVVLRCNWDVQCMDRVFVGLQGGMDFDNEDPHFQPGDEVDDAAQAMQYMQTDAAEANPSSGPNEYQHKDISAYNPEQEKHPPHANCLSSTPVLSHFDDPCAEIEYDVDMCRPCDHEGAWSEPEDSQFDFSCEEAEASGDELNLLDDSSDAQVIAKRFLRAMERAFRDAHDSAFYTGDYSTKGGPTVGSILGEQVAGVEGLLQSHTKQTPEDLEELGRLLLVRLQTAANRAMLKKLPEMIFQMLYLVL